jgi:hypothetical protein
MKDLNIYEMEYSCSPGGIDKWEIEERDGDFFQGDFDTAEDAISYALLKFDGEELNLNIKSLKWYHKQEEEEENKEEWETRMDKAVQDGEFAFWAEIVKHFPEATSGDFDPMLSMDMAQRLQGYLSHWLDCNHPTYGKDNK